MIKTSTEYRDTTVTENFKHKISRDNARHNFMLKPPKITMY